MRIIEQDKLSDSRLTQIQLAFDSAAFLWLLRRDSINQPDYCFNDVIELDNRINSYIDVLDCYPEVSWHLSEEAIVIGQPGEMFVAGIIAFKSRDMKKIQTVTEIAVKHEETFFALSHSVAWLPPSYSDIWISRFFSSKELNHKRLALLACELRQDNPGDHLKNILERVDCQNDELIYSQALKQAGELKRFDLLPLIRQGLSSLHNRARYWARYALIMMGENIYLNELKPWMMKETDFKATAATLVFRLLPIADAKNWLLEILQDAKQIRFAIRACGILGDPQVIPWLIKTMQDPRYAQLCGEAFSNITGINLKEQGLTLESLPDLDAILPEIDEDIEFQVDQDQQLDYPDASKIGAVWQKYQYRFKPQNRYFLGHLIDSKYQYLKNIKKDSHRLNMRQLSRLAYETALSSTSQPLQLPNKVGH